MTIRTVIIAIASAFLAAQTVYAGSKSIEVINKCKASLTIGVLTNGKPSSDQTFELDTGSSQTISKSDNWGGRIWGQYHCSSGNKNSDICGTPGTKNPASLAEFFFHGNGGHDYYDISLVDGYNLPLTIKPKGSASTKGKYHCGSPSCDVPDCPKENTIVDSSGTVIGCQSSCSATSSDEDCCKGSYDDPNVCKPDERSTAVKQSCPDAYSFAYDDQSSTYNCIDDEYEVTFC
ncbi:thaumatin [Dichotomocladium elegans]|nr:thaumatin [Dichotomocladium elegans]